MAIHPSHRVIPQMPTTQAFKRFEKLRQYRKCLNRDIQFEGLMYKILGMFTGEEVIKFKLKRKRGNKVLMVTEMEIQGQLEGLIYEYNERVHPKRAAAMRNNGLDEKVSRPGV